MTQRELFLLEMFEQLKPIDGDYHSTDPSDFHRWIHYAREYLGFDYADAKRRYEAHSREMAQRRRDIDIMLAHVQLSEEGLEQLRLARKNADTL